MPVCADPSQKGRAVGPAASANQVSKVGVTVGYDNDQTAIRFPLCSVDVGPGVRDVHVVGRFHPPILKHEIPEPKPGHLSFDDPNLAGR